MIHFNRYLQDLLLPAAGVIIKFQGEQFSDYQKTRVTEIGRLIENNTSTSKFLDENLFTFTSDSGNTLLFDPGAGIHTGGIVKKGERIALMVVIDS